MLLVHLTCCCSVESSFDVEGCSSCDATVDLEVVSLLACVFDVVVLFDELISLLVFVETLLDVCVETIFSFVFLSSISWIIILNSFSALFE